MRQRRGKRPAAQQGRKKRHAVRRGLVVGVILLAAFSGCSAGNGGGRGSADKAAQQPAGAAGRASASVNLRPGQPFTLGGMRFHPGWRVRHTSLGSNVTGLEVTGKRGKARVAAQIELRLWSGDELLGIVSCSAGDLAEGQTKAMNCSGTSRPLINYTKITANTL